MAEQSVKKTSAKKSDKKPGFFDRISRFFRELKSESKKVVWPSKKQVINNTAVVLASCAIVGAFIWILDGALSGLVNLLLGLAG